MSSNKHEVVVIDIPNKLANYLQSLLNEQDVEVEDEDQAIYVFTAAFSDGYEADIKVCAGQNNYFIDPVLFHHGHEVFCLDCEGDLLGSYAFETDDITFEVILKTEEKLCL